MNPCSIKEGCMTLPQRNMCITTVDQKNKIVFALYIRFCKIHFRVIQRKVGLICPYCSCRLKFEHNVQTIEFVIFSGQLTGTLSKLKWLYGLN